MVCGLVGQAVANTAMLTRRALRAPDPDDDIVVSVPPLFKTALVWGLFMGVSANTRYQMVVGLERCAGLGVASDAAAPRSLQSALGAHTAPFACNN